MSKKTTTPRLDPDQLLQQQLTYLKLPCMRGQYEALTGQAAKEKWSHLKFFRALVQGESDLRNDKGVARRIRQARFGVVKTLDQFDYTWPKKINRMQIQQLAGMSFVKQKANVIFLGTVGLGKTHLSKALGYEACQCGHKVLYATAVDIINALAAAQAVGRLASELKKYLRPDVLIMDEMGYLPIDKRGADLLFQVISKRYEHGSIILSTNKAFKQWPTIFNNDSALASAVLDRLLHHSETVLITGKSHRMRGRNAEHNEKE